MKKLRAVEVSPGRVWMFACPRCKTFHHPNSTTHTFNGDQTDPTFSPAVTTGECICTVTDGWAEYPDGERKQLPVIMVRQCQKL